MSVPRTSVPRTSVPGRLFRGRSGEGRARVLVHLHNSLQGSDQNRPLQTKFFPVLDRESPQHLLTFRSQGHEHLPPILGPRESAHIPAQRIDSRFTSSTALWLLDLQASARILRSGDAPRPAAP